MYVSQVHRCGQVALLYIVAVVAKLKTPQHSKKKKSKREKSKKKKKEKKKVIKVVTKAYSSLFLVLRSANREEQNFPENHGREEAPQGDRNRDVFQWSCVKFGAP